MSLILSQAEIKDTVIKAVEKVMSGYMHCTHLGLHLNTTPHPRILAIPLPESFVVLCKKETRE